MLCRSRWEIFATMNNILWFFRLGTSLPEMGQYGTCQTHVYEAEVVEIWTFASLIAIVPCPGGWRSLKEVGLIPRSPVQAVW